MALKELEPLGAVRRDEAMISRLANERNRASVVTATDGLTMLKCRLRPTPPDPAPAP